MESERMQFSDQPEVEFLILADRAEVLNGKLYMMGGGWEQIGVTDFSAPVPVSLTVSIQVPWHATNRQHTWGLSVQTQDGADLTELEGNFALGRPPLLEEGASQRAMFAMMLPVTLPSAGTFVIVARINGEESRRIRFRALAAAPPVASGD